MPNENMITVRGRLKEMNQVRSTWTPHWSELSDFILPFNGRMLGGDAEDRENNGSKRSSNIIDGTATYAINVFNAGMQSGVTSPARPWFKTGLADKDLAEFGPVKEWLYLVEKILYRVFARSNFYNSVHQIYNELGCFGTGAMGIFEDFRHGIRCRPYTIGEYFLSLDQNLQVDTFYHLFWMTVRQMIATYGKNGVSGPVRELYESKQTETLIECVRAIEPNDDRIALPGVDFPYRAMHFERKGKDNENFLSTGGFDEFPIMAPRWDVVARDGYGTSPGMYILGDVKMLQLMQEKSLMALNKQVDPPLKAPGTLQGDVINSMPGGVTYGTDVTGRDSLGALYQVNLDVSAVEQKIAAVQEGIKKGFYNDLFMAITSNTSAGKRMTATEVAERHEEKLLMLGPAMERLHGELLDPAINRTFQILLRNGLIPPPPPELQEGMELQIQYISVLAQAQKMVGLTGIEQLAAYVGNLSSIYPEARYKFDSMNSVDEYADALGTTPSLLVSNEDAKEKYAAEQQAIAQQQNAEQGAQAAESAKLLSETDVGNENNLLNKLMGGGL